MSWTAWKMTMDDSQIQHYFHNIVHSDLKKRYKKKGRFIYRAAIENETILTMVSGELETIATAGKDDIIIKNIELGSSAETYILTKANFIARYDITEKTYFIDNSIWTETFAKGECIAFEYKPQNPEHSLEFKAPWGEMMLCKNGDFLAQPVPGKYTDIYRIERKTFLQTYSEIKEEEK